MEEMSAEIHSRMQEYAEVALAAHEAMRGRVEEHVESMAASAAQRE